jgi:cytochrome c oxidase assembly protein subunit 15
VRKLDRFQRFALLTTAATYLLIGIGGLVRAAGAGLGCPDWPKCFDRWVPPTEVSQVPPHIDPALFNFTKAWIEWLNRLTGVAVGLLIFGTLVLAVLHYRRSRRVLWSTFAAFLLVGIEGWIGGQVVRSQLEPLVLTVHLVFALIVVSLLLYATVSAFFPQGRQRVLTRDRVLLGRAAIAVIAVALIQSGLGAAVRGEVQHIAEAGVLPRERWLSGVGLVDLVHQNFAVVTGIAVLALAWWVFARVEPDRWLRGFAVVSVAILFAQAGAGIGMATRAFPPWMQVAHLWLGSLLLGVLTVIALLAYRLDPRDADLAQDQRSWSMRSASSSAAV